MPDRDLSPREARLLLQRCIDEHVAERGDIYYTHYDYDLQRLAGDALDAFGDDKSQMRKLEQIALGASTFADVIDYIKRQVGRDTKVGKQWRKGHFGKRLHNVLWEQVRSQAESSAGSIKAALKKQKVWKVLQADREERMGVSYKEKDLQRTLRLAMTREYIKHLVSHYVYLKSKDQAA